MSAARLRDIVIVGAGLAGHAAALVLARRGMAVQLVGPVSPRPDTRTTALLQGSVALLEEAGVWEGAKPLAAPLETMAIVDATRRLVRARPVAFEAAEIGLAAFGWNIANLDLLAIMARAANRSPLIERIEESVVGADCRDADVSIELADGRRILAQLVVAADGRASPMRTAAGIETKDWRYPQAALTVNLSHARAHRNISTEFHYETGACTLVPLSGNRSSLVLMVGESEADRLSRLDPAALAAEIERRVHSILGRIVIESASSTWSMAGLSANRLAANRVALVGEAAHVFPPIGAQGFNLTMRDIGALADALAENADPGASAVLETYHDSRRGDVSSRTIMVDLMNRSLLTDFLPIQIARSAGLYALDRVPALRRIAMRQGLAGDQRGRATVSRS